MEKTEKEILEELGKKLKMARKAIKLSQSGLASKTWIDRSYISMVERGITNITFLKLKKLDEHLSLNLINNH